MLAQPMYHLIFLLLENILITPNIFYVFKK
jgi:hypothetical protein